MDGSGDPPKTDQEKRYEVFLEERKSLLATAKEAAAEYAKAIMALSGGALALSITFMEKLAPTPAAGTLWILIAAWSMFASSLLVVVTSFLLAQFAFFRQVTLSQAFLLAPSEAKMPAPVNAFAKWIQSLTILALVLFFLGLLFTIVFAGINLYAPKSPSPTCPSPCASQQSSPDPEKKGVRSGYEKDARTKGTPPQSSVQAAPPGSPAEDHVLPATPASATAHTR